MGYRHQRDDLLEAAVDLALTDGIGTLTFGNVARHAGTNDRTVVYYFPSKHDLTNEVALALGARLHDLLESAFGPDPLPAGELLERAWPVLGSTAADPVFGTLFELVGLAAVRQEPAATVAPLLLNRWVDWLVPHIRPESPQRTRGAARAARSEALAIVAQLQGLLVLRHTCGARAANSAARHLGIIDR